MDGESWIMFTITAVIVAVVAIGVHACTRKEIASVCFEQTKDTACWSYLIGEKR